MKTTIEKLTRTDVEVEIPDACPYCQQPFSEGGLLEDNWNRCEVRGHIEVDTFEPNGSSDYSDAYIVVGYRCQCGHVLASTED